MRVLGFVLSAILTLGVCGAAPAALGLADPTEPSVDGEPQNLGCLDNPEYFCFAECDTSWDVCVTGHAGCLQLWEYNLCVDDPNFHLCCVIAIRDGLF
jgi:hypothetical protein